MSLPSENDNNLVNNILQDIQETENNPESVFNRQMDDMINHQQSSFQPQMQPLQQTEQPQQYSFHQDIVGDAPLNEYPMAVAPPVGKKFNYIKYATMFMLFVIVFVGVTHPMVFSFLNGFKSLISAESVPNIAGTSLLAVVGGIIFVVLQHFIL
jgi:hypothetical protein